MHQMFSRSWLAYITWRSCTRACRYWWQRRTRGWDDSDLWSLDSTIARFIAPRLARFRTTTRSYPHDLTAEEWDAKLALMQRAFAWLASDEKYSQEQPDYVDAGIKEFVEWYGHLWS